MDKFTIRNLELLGSSYEGEQGHSLLKVLDNTVSPMGARLAQKMAAHAIERSAGRSINASTRGVPYQRPRACELPRPTHSANAATSKGWSPGYPCARSAPRIEQLARGLEEIAQIRTGRPPCPMDGLHDLCLSPGPLPRRRIENKDDHRRQSLPQPPPKVTVSATASTRIGPASQDRQRRERNIWSNLQQKEAGPIRYLLPEDRVSTTSSAIISKSPTHKE
jgi:hypothetical protein